jgi:hypothetical protein
MTPTVWAGRRLPNQHDGLAKPRVGHVRLRHEQHAIRRGALGLRRAAEREEQQRGDGADQLNAWMPVMARPPNRSQRGSRAALARVSHCGQPPDQFLLPLTLTTGLRILPRHVPYFSDVLFNMSYTRATSFMPLRSR